MIKLTAVSLFSGAGGLDVGFKRAGFQIVAANELDTTACKTYRVNHPETTLFEGDINYHIESFRTFEGVDIVFGGPPCQGFSVAGKMDVNDPRSQLIFSFANALDVIKPRAFIMENVKTLATLSKFQSVRDDLLKKFNELGYQVSIHILNAKDYGSAQSRERAFFIGTKQNDQHLRHELLQKYKHPAVSVRSIIQHLGPAGSPTNPKVCNAKITIAKNPILRQSPYAGMLFNGQGRPINPDGWSSTLPASMGGNRTPIIDERHLYDNQGSWIETYHATLLKNQSKISNMKIPSFLRRLTVDETALLQGFPKDYIFIGSQSKVYTQIGNAVPCTLAESIACTVRDILKQKNHLNL